MVSKCRLYFISFGIIEPIPVILNRIPLKPALGGVCSLANYSFEYEETQSNRVSDFRNFVCSLFLKAILLDFYSYMCLFCHGMLFISSSFGESGRLCVVTMAFPEYLHLYFFLYSFSLRDNLQEH